MSRPLRATLRSALYYFIVVVAPSILFLWRLRSQTHGISISEAQSLSAAELSNIVKDPLNLPYKLLENALFHIGHHPILAIRLTSVIFGMLFVFLLFYVLRVWFGKPIALLTTLLFGLTPLYLLSSRVAEPNIMFASSVVLLFAYYFSKHNQSKLWVSIIAAIGLVFCLYIPGLFWLILISVAFWFTLLRDSIRSFPKKIISSAIILILLLLLPLFYSFAQDPSLIKSWLLLPQTPPHILDALKNTAWYAGLPARPKGYT